MKLHRIIFALILAVTLGPSAWADFPISTNVNLDIQPQVAYNSANQEYLVVWGEMVPFGGNFIPGRILGQRVAEDGTLLGSAFQIFSNGTYSRVAYNPALNEYLVITAPGTGILGQRVSNSGTLIGGSIGLMTDQSYGRILYNELSADYLLVAGQLVETSAGSGYWNLKIYSRRLSATGQPTGSLVFIDEIADGYGGPEPAFAVAYAPIQSPETPNGRYLMVTGRGIMVTMLNSEGAPINVVYDPYHPGTTYRYVPFRTGSGVGGEFNVDVAYGTESGYSMTGSAFFVVWADQNNRWQNQQWSGIYGGFIDANKISYATDEVIKDNAFPISAIADHWAYDSHVESWRPRVAYNAPAGKYMVTWRETPGTSSYNDTKVNHIRADKEFEAITMNPNDVLSTTTGNENPEEPAIAASTISGKGLVAWIDYRNSASTKQDIYGTVYTIADVPPPPPPPPPATTWIVTNTNDAGAGSLRQAILNANARIGLDTIAFNIPGTNLRTIQPLSEFPAITDPVLIDGYTQPGSSINTNAFEDGLNTILKVEIDGTYAGTAANGLTVTAGRSTVRGLVINRFDSCAIKLAGSGGNKVEGNYIGMDATGTTPLNNKGFGIVIYSSPDNFIGGTAVGARNLISGNGYVQGNTTFGGAVSVIGTLSRNTVMQGNLIGVSATGKAKFDPPLYGVRLFANHASIGGAEPNAGNVIAGLVTGLWMWADSNTVQGNLIGTDITGAIPLGNDRGLHITGGFNLIGGLTPTARNIISGNVREGIFIGTNGQSGNVVEGNFIGTRADGTSPLGNGSQGMSVYGAENCVTIGGTDDGAGNTIAFNGREGIRMPLNCSGVRILRNSIFANMRLGIDLVGGTEDASGVTANDPGDADTGPNNLQNYPVLTTAEGGDYLSLNGSLNSKANTTFRLEFFATPSEDTASYREGQTFLGWTEVTTDGSGNISFSLTIGVPVAAGRWITATATDPNGNTSEFSDPVLIQYTSGDLTVTNTNDDGPGSLRQAMLAANTIAGTNTITFGIPGNGPHVIHIKEMLPSADQPVVIDGYTQPGSSVNTNPFADGNNAKIVIEIDGTNCTSPSWSPGIHLRGGASIVRGLAINNFHSGIFIEENGGNRVEGCFIGMDPTGVMARPNIQGIIINSSYNRVGGTVPAQRNVISGNEATGVIIGAGSAANHNEILGNYIGTTASGTEVLGDQYIGIRLTGARENRIGGPGGSAGNLISGIGLNPDGTVPAWSGGDLGVIGFGVLVGDNGSNNEIVGNLIGTNAAGNRKLPNAMSGVVVWGDSNAIGSLEPGYGNTISGCLGGGIWVVDFGLSHVPVFNHVYGNRIGTDVGGTKPLGNRHGVVVQGATHLEIGEAQETGAANVIAYNDSDGVRILGSSNAVQLGINSIFANGMLGINLVGGTEDSRGCTQNDAGDQDTGPNGLQNHPEITTTMGKDAVTCHVALHALPDAYYYIHIYTTPASEPLRFGEGQTLLGAMGSTTDHNGLMEGSVTLELSNGAPLIVSATATDANGNTSEFSPPIVVVTGVNDGRNLSLPRETALLQNYPNPFNPKTGVRFQVSGVSDVRIAVYDILGKEVALLVNERKTPGNYEVPFDASGLASGMYIYRMTAGTFVATKTMLLVK
jgi:hypothetical protein